MGQRQGVGAKQVRRRQQSPLARGGLAGSAKDHVARGPELRGEIVVRTDPALPRNHHPRLGEIRLEFDEENVEADDLGAFPGEFPHQPAMQMARPRPTVTELLVENLEAVVVDENGRQIGRDRRGAVEGLAHAPIVSHPFESFGGIEPGKPPRQELHQRHDRDHRQREQNRRELVRCEFHFAPSKTKPPRQLKTALHFSAPAARTAPTPPGRDALPRVRALSLLPAELTRSRTNCTLPHGAHTVSQGKPPFPRVRPPFRGPRRPPETWPPDLSPPRKLRPRTQTPDARPQPPVPPH